MLAKSKVYADIEEEVERSGSTAAPQRSARMFVILLCAVVSIAVMQLVAYVGGSTTRSSMAWELAAALALGTTVLCRR